MILNERWGNRKLEDNWRRSNKASVSDITQWQYAKH